jgi:hypothetical protein
MPFLSGEDRDKIAQQSERECSICKQMIHKAYCSRCDEFYEVGHKADCDMKDAPHNAATCGGDRGYR